MHVLLYCYRSEIFCTTIFVEGIILTELGIGRCESAVVVNCVSEAAFEEVVGTIITELAIGRRESAFVVNRASAVE